MRSVKAMQSVRKFVAPEIVFGDGALEMLGRYVTNFGANRVKLCQVYSIKNYH